MKNNQENCITPLNAQSTTLIPSPAKDKRWHWREADLEGYQAKHSKLKIWLLWRYKALPSSLISISTDLASLLYLCVSGRETPLQMEISLVNANVSSKRVTSTGFEFLLCVLFLKNNQSKIFLRPTRQTLLPSTTIMCNSSCTWTVESLSCNG